MVVVTATDPLSAYVEALSSGERSSLRAVVEVGQRVVSSRPGLRVDLEPAELLLVELGGGRRRRGVGAARGAPMVRVADLGDVGVTHRTVTRWAERGDLDRADKRGRDWWVDRAEVVDRAADPRRRRTRAADDLRPPADS